MIQHIVDAVGTERKAHTRHARQSENTRQIVVTSAARYAAHLHAYGFHFQYRTGVVVQPASQRQIEFNTILQLRNTHILKHFLQFGDTFHTRFRRRQHLFQTHQFFGIRPFEQQYRLQFGHSIGRNALRQQLRIHIVQSNFVHLVDGHRYIDYAIGLAHQFGDTGQNFAVVQFHHYRYFERLERLVNHLDQFGLVQQRIAAHHIGIALIELAITSFLRTVGAPHRLNLIAFERKRQLVAMLHHITCKRHRQVVTQTFFGDLRRQFDTVACQQLVVGQPRCKIARVQHFEQQFVALFAIFAHQCR